LRFQELPIRLAGDILPLGARKKRQCHEPVTPVCQMRIQPTNLSLSEGVLTIEWSDGHDTGIYTLELLRQLGRENG
jgi:DUF971 family protein